MAGYTEEELAKYADAIAKLQTDTESAVYRFFMNYAINADGTVKEAALVDAMCLLVEKYGDSVMSLTVNWLQLGYVRRAKDHPSAVLLREAALEALTMATAPDREQMARYVRDSCRFVRTSKAARAAAGKQVAARTAAEAKRRGYRLIEDTFTFADATAEQMGMSPLGLQVIWYPRGVHPCAFCTMLASNSWRVASKEALSDYIGHVHDNCYCTLIFKPPDEAVAGVTPRKYLDRLYSVIETDADGTEYVVTSDGRRINHLKPNGKVSSGYWEEVTLALRRKDYADPAIGGYIREQHREQYDRTHPKDDE